MSLGTGAKLFFMSIVTIVRVPPLSSFIPTTLPTFTPAMRTSACWASVVASGNATLNS